MSSGSFGFAWVHSCAPKGHWVYSGSRGFTPAHLGGLPVHYVLRGFTPARLEAVGFIRVRVGSLGFAAGSSDSFWLAWVQYRRPRGRLDHWSSSRLTRVRLAVVGFIRVRVGSLSRA